MAYLGPFRLSAWAQYFLEAAHLRRNTIYSCHLSRTLKWAKANFCPVDDPGAHFWEYLVAQNKTDYSKYIFWKYFEKILSSVGDSFAMISTFMVSFSWDLHYSECKIMKLSCIPSFSVHVFIWDQHESKLSVKSGHFLAFSAFSLHAAVFAAKPEHSLRSAIQLITLRQRLQW